MEINSKELKRQQKARMKEIKKFNSKMYKKYNREKKIKNVPESHYITTMSIIQARYSHSLGEKTNPIIVSTVPNISNIRPLFPSKLFIYPT